MQTREQIIKHCYKGTVQTVGRMHQSRVFPRRGPNEHVAIKPIFRLSVKVTFKAKQQAHDVKTTVYRRQCDVMTSRHIDVDMTLF